MPLTDAIKAEARALGFDAVGVSLVPVPPARDADSLQARLGEWLRRGFHGAMGWMAREPARRADPRTVLAGCRSIISVGMNYYSGHRADERPGYGRIARYAWGKDYHGLLQPRLEQLAERIQALAPGAETRTYVDTGPVMEKAWAERAGLGWIGKHSNLVSTRYGSWLVLGEVLTTLELEPDEPAADLCGTCTLCIKACPTGAITEPYVVDARRCISYLTIELHKPGDEIPDDLAPNLGNRIFGCDDCLDVCPYNVNASATAEPAFQPAPVSLAADLEQLAGMDDRTFASVFRESPIRRAKHAGLLRNVRLAHRNEQQNVHPQATRQA